jgi:peptidyl-prolyl cis-trans isomerase A (cyclophilin A)
MKNINLKYLIIGLAFSLIYNPAVADDSENLKIKKKSQKMFALFDTDLGSFKVKLFFTQTPKTVENFAGLAEGTKEWKDPKSKKLVKRPFYDGLIFHRVIKGFMIQTGDPLGNGTGGSGVGTIPDEFKPELTHGKEGILSMANIGQPNTGDSQIFITLGKADHLNNRHTVFGEVIEGIETVRKIGAVETSGPPHDRPLKPVRIKTIKIIRE